MSSGHGRTAAVLVGWVVTCGLAACKDPVPIFPDGPPTPTPADTTYDIEVMSTETLNSLAPPRPVTAREPTFTGTVYEVTPTGWQPVVGAAIEAYGADGLGWVLANAITDLSGHYLFCDLAPGMDLMVSKDGYELKEVYPVGGPPSTTLDIEIVRK